MYCMRFYGNRLKIKMADDEAPRPPISGNNKGTVAKFLRENPRFINEPICNLVSSDNCSEVKDCLAWKQSTNEGNVNSKPPW